MIIIIVFNDKGDTHLFYYKITLMKIKHMKTILVPIDFSETSDNALNYAVNLAKQLSANILLLHVNTIPVYNNEQDVASYTINDSITDSLDVLEEKATLLKKANLLHGDVSCHAEAGDLKTAISDIIFF